LIWVVNVVLFEDLLQCLVDVVLNGQALL
jgi:hypothetical protein